MITEPLFRIPAFSASSTICSPTLSLALPAGLKALQLCKDFSVYPLCLCQSSEVHKRGYVLPALQYPDIFCPWRLPPFSVSRLLPFEMNLRINNLIFSFQRLIPKSWASTFSNPSLSIVSEKRSPVIPCSRNKESLFPEPQSTSSSDLKIFPSSLPSAVLLPHLPPITALNPFVSSVTASNGHFACTASAVITFLFRYADRAVLHGRRADGTGVHYHTAFCSPCNYPHRLPVCSVR